MNLQDANAYLAYNVKMGTIDPMEIEGLSDKDLIQKAEQLEARADWLYESYKEIDLGDAADDMRRAF